MQNDRSPSPELPLRKRLLFSAVLFALVALVLEVGAATYLELARGYDGEHLLQYQFDPYKNILPTPNYVDTRGVAHNSVGFRRSAEVAREKPAGTFRIFLMGASTAYGTGGLWPHLQRDYQVLKNSETIDAYLQQYLAEALPGVEVEVINAGIPSTWTHHELIYLNQTVLRYDPDMVLFLDGFNDFYFFEPGHDQFARYAYGEQAHEIMGDPTVSSLVAANGWWWFRRSAFVHLAARTARDLKTMVTPRPEQRPIEVPEALEGLQRTFAGNALKMIRRTSLIAQDEGVVPVFMLQPLLILERERARMPEVERRLFEFNVQSTLPNYEEFMRRAVPLVSRMEAEALDEVGGEFIDLTGVFADAEGQIFTDYAHLTPHGNSILARYVADRIAPLIRDRIGRAPPLTWTGHS